MIGFEIKITKMKKDKVLHPNNRDNPNRENPFKSCDQVFHHRYATRGNITDIVADGMVWVEWNGSRDCFPWQELSFTKYNLIYGGLSHSRPVDPGMLSLVCAALEFYMSHDLYRTKSKESIMLEFLSQYHE